MTLAKFELKNLLRDKMTVFMFIYPRSGNSKYLITNNYVDGAALGITAMLMAILTGFAYGAMAGFLGDRDDHVLPPANCTNFVKLHIWFKYITPLAVLKFLLVLVSLPLLWDLILISALSACKHRSLPL